MSLKQSCIKIFMVLIVSPSAIVCCSLENLENLLKYISVVMQHRMNFSVFFLLNKYVQMVNYSLCSYRCQYIGSLAVLLICNIMVGLYFIILFSFQVKKPDISLLSKIVLCANITLTSARLFQRRRNFVIAPNI